MGAIFIHWDTTRPSVALCNLEQDVFFGQRQHRCTELGSWVRIGKDAPSSGFLQFGKAAQVGLQLQLDSIGETA